MNYVAEDISSILKNDAESIAHYGMPHRSGRYPWGSGDDPSQHGSGDFISRIDELKKQGWTETPDNIMSAFGMSTTQYRTERDLVKNERKMVLQKTVESMAKDGFTATQIGRKVGKPESTIRNMLDEKVRERRAEVEKTADIIREQINKRGMIDVGGGVEHELGISDTKLKQVLSKLEKEGYPIYRNRIEQVTNPTGKTSQTIICPKGTEHKEIYDVSKIHPLFEDQYVPKEGENTSKKQFVFPKSLDGSRVHIRYTDEKGPDGITGLEKDGLIEIRRGVDDLSLGNDRYAQVRILVNGNKYLKGMAVYSDNIPDGVDVVFNTNKTKEDGFDKALKKIKDDPDNPFGSLIKADGQSYYTDKNGKEQLSCINKARSEGDWEDWKDALPSQFLSKQSLALAKKQLNLAITDKQVEFENICSLTNPTIKKHYLESFADDCDAAAVDLKAAALPSQKFHVIVPINTLKDNEIYAPRYEDGTKLALVRYPHGGIFEIPILTVNNKHQPARELLGTDSVDAVGINKSNADRLSGADFDGDTVMCIPTHDKSGKIKIASSDPLERLKNFEPKIAYKECPGMRYMKNPDTGVDNTKREMGMISNLICDMTLGGATSDELAAAVRHSMVVIDAAKHKLNYKQSELDNNIAALKRKFQPKFDEEGNVIGGGGASTLISKSKSDYSVLKRQGSSKINTKYKSNGEPNEYYDPTRPEGAKLYKLADDLYYPERSKYNKDTGEVTYKTADGKKITYNINDKDAVEKYKPVKVVDKKSGTTKYTNKDGSIVYNTLVRMQKSSKMAETDNAYTLVSNARHPMEIAYADYANAMKNMANQARIAIVNTGNLEYNPSAAITYSREVESLKSKIAIAELNRPRERAAQRAVTGEIKNKVASGELTETSDIKKAKQQSITKYRYELGGVARKDRSIKITDSEWEAIQAGAIHENILKKILSNSDASILREKAMPKNSMVLSDVKIGRIKAMSASDATISQMAKSLGVSESTISKYLKGDK